MKSVKTIDNVALCKAVCTEHECISDAPEKYPDNIIDMREKDAVLQSMMIERWTAEERFKRYSSVDPKSGDILLIQNPFVWRLEEKDGIRTRIRPKPRLYLTAYEAQQKLKSGG